jgi:hypothetical protein
MINISVPDHIQAMLVDDWENITKNNQLVPLPHANPVSKIFEDYLAVERPRREEGSSSMDILEEVIAGFREYFEKALSRILLYRYAGLGIYLLQHFGVLLTHMFPDLSVISTWICGNSGTMPTRTRSTRVSAMSTAQSILPASLVRDDTAAAVSQTLL